MCLIPWVLLTVSTELAAEAKRMRQGLEGGMLTQKECKVSLQTTLTRELKAKHWVAALECLTTMHDLGLVPSAPSLAAFVQVCACS